MASKTVQFTTRELSPRTFPDFEQFSSQVHGCACTLYFFGRHLTPVAHTAKEGAVLLGTPDRSRKHFPHRALMRERELESVRELVGQRKAHGILVYDDAEPVGWCHFGRADEVPVNRGGGWIETTPMAFPHDDPIVRKLRKTFGWRSPKVINYIRDNWPTKEIAGVGRVDACLTRAGRSDTWGRCRCSKSWASR